MNFSIRNRNKMLSVNKSEEGDQNWLITLSDFLTLLLVFFIMFYMMTKNHSQNKTITEQNKSQSSSILETNSGTKIDIILNNFNDSIKQLKLDENVSAVNINNEIVITMKEKILFKPADAWLLDEAYPSLKVLAEIIKKNNDFIVEIEGHTDNLPIHNKLYPSNWELSLARAISVLRYFTESEGINASRFSVKGNADNKPIAENKSNSRSNNRRVEIRLKGVVTP